MKNLYAVRVYSKNQKRSQKVIRIDRDESVDTLAEDGQIWAIVSADSDKEALKEATALWSLSVR